MAPRNAPQRRFLWCLGVFTVAASVVWLGSIAGDRFGLLATHDQTARPGTESFRVAGSSMVPTLYGPTLRINCVHCQHEILFDRQNASGDRGDLICSLCGERHDLSDRDLAGSLTSYLGDVVQVSEVPTNEYRIGDLVAIDQQGSMQVKRIAALAGNVVDLDDLHLLVDGQRLEDRIASEAKASPPPAMTIDDDSLRAKSRWSAADDGNRWVREKRGSWRSESESTWLIYHHRNVHDHNRSSGVMDDYQYNAGIARQLESVDRLSIAGTLSRAGGATIEVAFWSREANVLAAQSIKHREPFEISFANGTPADDLPVTREQPVAIRIAGDDAAIELLTVQRDVEYRINPQHDRRPYPLRIPADHCFVVGDNVPFSIDSRHWGPVQVGRIRGRVQVIESIKPTDALSAN